MPLVLGRLAGTAGLADRVIRLKRFGNGQAFGGLKIKDLTSEG
ncbi:MAG TPA: hypothetical protein VG848_10860 [Acetobacteraceae bacterium]|nr:hypothetical protein [Acetobacteraceae bacterium]